MLNLNEGTDDSLLILFFNSINKKLIIIPLCLIFIGIFTLFSLNSDINLLKHLIYVIISLSVFFSIIFLKKDNLKTFLNFFLFFLILLLIYTFFFGYEINGARRWIRFFGFSIQPSELIKGPFICFVSWFFYLRLKNINYKILYIPFFVFIIILFLIANQPDFATSMYFFTSFSLISLLYIRKIKFFLILSFFGLLFTAIIISLNQYVRDRILIFFLDTSRQVELSINAINKGGLVGVGLGEGQLKYFIPEKQNDFIYSIIIEEVGILFGILIVFLYPLYLYVAKKSADSLNNLFLKNTVFTLAFMTCFQAFVNISTSIDLFVPTGMPLPFVSYGGSSLLSYAIIFGTVANFTRYEKSSFNQSS